MNGKELKNHVDNFWEEHIVPTLFEYIKIPNKSPSFDKNWKEKVDKYFDYICKKRDVYEGWFVDNRKLKPKKR